MKKLGIRGRLIVIVAGVLIGAISIAAVMIQDLVYENIIKQKITMVDVLTASIVHDIKYDYDTNKTDTIDNVLSKYVSYYRIIKKMQFVDENFISISSSQKDQLGQLIKDEDIVMAISKARPSIRVVKYDKKSLSIRSVAPIFLGSKIFGAISIDVSIADIENTLAVIERRMSTIIVITVLLASLLLFIVLRSTILLRLSRLMSLTREIAAGNYTIKLADGRADEIGELSRSFDQMTDHLNKSRQEINKHNEHLEYKVTLATQELKQAYEDLKNAQSQIVLSEKMASLGVLISGIAHEINTPVGAISNVSRSLSKKAKALPKLLVGFSEEKLDCHRMAACIEEIVTQSQTIARPPSFKQVKALENLLEERGLKHWRDITNVLINLNYYDLDKVESILDCCKSKVFVDLVEILGGIMQAAKISETSTSKIQNIIKALKYYAYTDNDKVEAISINQSIQTALVLLENKLNHSVKVTTSYEDNIPLVMCTSEIHQIWTNLLTNAVDAIEEMGEDYQGVITIETSFDADNIKISITDNGSGIPEEIWERVYDPFFTSKDIGKGTGLGLSIVSGIVKKHHGSICFKSQQGLTAFNISLPQDKSIL